MVSEALKAIFKARGQHLQNRQGNDHDTRRLRKEREQECIRTLNFAQETPWEWPEAPMNDHEEVVKALRSDKVPKTLLNLRLFAEPVDLPDGTTSIWHFKKKAWVKWEPEKNKAAFGEMLFMCAQKLVKVMYFCSHCCDSKPLNDYIPEEFVLQVFSTENWSKNVKEEESKFNSRIFVAVLLNTILPRWQEDEAFPKPFDSKRHNATCRSPEFEYFKQQAISDPDASAHFYGKLGDSVDWKEICKEPIENKVAYDWGIECLAAAADIAYRLGYGRKNHALDTSALMMRFVAMGKEKRRPPYQAILLQEDFGQERITNVGMDVRKRKRAAGMIDDEHGPEAGERAPKLQKRVGSGNLHVQSKEAADVVHRDRPAQRPEPTSRSPKRDLNVRFGAHSKEATEALNRDRPAPAQLPEYASKKRDGAMRKDSKSSEPTNTRRPSGSMVARDPFDFAIIGRQQWKFEGRRIRVSGPEEKARRDGKFVSPVKQKGVGVLKQSPLTIVQEDIYEVPDDSD